MKTQETEEKTITGSYLKEKLLIKSDRTIESYVTDGSLPTPIKEIENSDLLFDKETVLKMLGVNSLEEEFVNTETAAKILNADISTVQSFARKGLIPCYRLKNVKGSQILYLLSEIEAAKQYTIQWQVSFGNNLIIKTAIKTIFSKLLDENNSLLTSRETDVLKLVLLEDKKPEEIAGKFDLTRERIKHIFQHGIKRLYLRMDELTEALNKKPDTQAEINTLKDKLNVLEAELNQYRATKNGRAALPEETQILLSAELKDFDISKRALNILNAYELNTVADLARIGRSDFLNMRNAGKKSADELQDFLKVNSLTWNMKI